MSVATTKLEIPTADELIAAADVAFENMERENEYKPSVLKRLNSRVHLGATRPAHA